MFCCDAKHSDVLRWSSHIYCYILTSLHSQTRNFLPKHHNTIIKQHLCGERLHLCCLCSKLIFFNRNRVYCSKASYDHQASQKKACTRPFDTNNYTQSLTRKYHHTRTESLYRLCDEKISWTPTLAGVSYQFDFVRFPICLQCKISGSSVFSIFS